MERYLDNDGTRIWTTSAGKGVPTIFVNGGPGCDDYLEPVSRMIEDRCLVVRFEPRGCGRSDYDGRYDLDTTLGDIDFVRQAYEFDRVLLLGHSAGGDLALAYAIRWPERVSGIIGIAGGRIVNDRDWHEDYRRNRETVGDALPKTFVADPEVNRIGNLTWKAYIKQPTLLSDIAKINCLVTFINGGRDIRPNWPTQQLAGLISDARYIEIEDAHHYPWMTHAETLRELLHQALDRMIRLDVDRKSPT